MDYKRIYSHVILKARWALRLHDISGRCSRHYKKWSDSVGPWQTRSYFYVTLDKLFQPIKCMCACCFRTKLWKWNTALKAIQLFLSARRNNFQRQMIKSSENDSFALARRWWRNFCQGSVKTQIVDFFCALSQRPSNFLIALFFLVFVRLNSTKFD